MKIDLLLTEYTFQRDETIQALQKEMNEVFGSRGPTSKATLTLNTPPIKIHEIRIEAIRRVALATAKLSAQRYAVLPWGDDVAVIARAGECRPYLEQLRTREQLSVCSWYYDVDPLSPFFRYCAFGDYEAEGTICWDLAKGDANSVLVLCDFPGHGNWWRPVTAGAEPLCVRVKKLPRHDYGVPFEHPDDGVQVVYRVSSRDVLAQFWSRTSYNDGIAYVCTSDDGDPEDLLEFYANPKPDGMFRFTEQHAWIYQQRYGGGADEHYAEFAAKSPQLALDVYRHAERRATSSNDWWAAGMS